MTSRFMAVGTVLSLAAVIALGITMPGVRFGDSAFLAGVVAAVLPLVIHLIGRPRATPHRFAAISLLLRAERRVARRIELGNLALLVLRTLATAFIPIILARPHAPSSEIDRPPPAPDASTVVVLDASFSMQMRLRGSTLFDLARDRVREVVRDMGAAEEIALIVARKSPERVTAGLSADRAQLLAIIGKLDVSSERADIAAALVDAEAVLQSSTRAARRVVLVSDFAGPDFPNWRPTDATMAYYRTDVSRAARRQNRAITGVRAQPAFDLGTNMFRFAVSVANHSDEPARALAVRLHVAAKDLSGTLDIAPRSEATKDFHVALPLGEVLTGRASIDSDDLPLDDSIPFTVSSNLGPRVLVVNGAPSTISHRDEAHYLARALRVVSTPQGPPRATVITPDEPADMAAFDIIFLCNLASEAATLNPTRVRDLEAAVRRGAGLVVTVGSNTTTKTFAGNLDRLLPAALHTENIRSPTAPLTLLPPATDRAATRAFREANAIGAASPSFTRAMVVLPKAGANVQTLLRFSDGTPALLEQTLDSGRVLLFASTIDRDWTDLPIRPVFAPWIADLIDALTPAMSVERNVRVHPGEPLPLPRDMEVVVTSPSGDAEKRSPRDTSPFVARQIGLYRIDARRPDGPRSAKPTTTTVAVTPDPAESNIAKGETAPRDARASVASAKNAAQPLGPPLMTVFAVALLLLLLAEAVVLVRR